ncbi:hypothetical protein [Marinovum sp.]|uniref:hypothetical protein n=1 Tax=Marinovum sp. TaxID=2024839 RepID=UPI002B27979D|nr:hypothetical protein [Marinovum sp.]
MLGQHVLDLIWEKSVAMPDADLSDRFLSLFSRILPVRTAPLMAGGACDAPLAMSDNLEVAAGLPLGDVLVEELPLDLTYDTLVVFLPGSQRSLGCLLGGAVAETLILALAMGDVPVERETEALHVLAQAAMRRAAELKATGAVLDMGGFRLGMAQALGRHWMVDAALTTQPDFLGNPAMIAHLTRLDPGFSEPDLSLFGSRLLDVASEPVSLDEWISRTNMMLRACLGAPERAFEPLQQDISSRFNFH